ncbi:class I adenylate-forming enzyme family protein [Fontimonas sp. SYSU GA230001]|uniref:class I adenylate-forming enzyme family protein n=1 Tax=Fontimonas sp. SYSU GA230001 TaxID=3142450 RepID=UPI0032B48403
MNISTILDMAAEAFGERIGVVAGDTRYSYAQLRELAYRAARRFKASGARYVALLDVNSPAAPVALFGAAYAGIPYVPVNYRLTRAEINELLARVAPAVVVVGPEQRAQIDARADLQLLDRAELLSLPDDGGEVPVPEEDPRAVAVQLFTSGTTGKPKAAILRHENLMSYIVGTVEFASADENDAIIVSVPPYHIAGISAVLSSTYACRRMVQLESFEPKSWLAAARAEDISNAFLVPTMLQRIVEHLDASGEAPDLPALRAIAYGGGKMPLSTIQRAMALFPNVDFTNAYGLTETSSTIAVLGPEDHRAAYQSADPQVRRRLGSVGKPAAVEIEIRDESGQVLGPEQAGLVFVRGPQVSGEYLSLGSQLDADGWFPTKDRGYLDAEGYLFLDGRADDVIVRGGENISPGEIEEVLLSHPAVADVACVAMPDEQWGEAVAAAVVLKDGAKASAQELQELVKGRLRSSRVPQKIVFKDALPYNETGKVLRRVIRQEFA